MDRIGTLQPRNIVITGAAGGIGTATVEELLKEQRHRLTCVDADISSLKALESRFGSALESGRLVPVLSELRNYDECASLVADIHGGVGGLVHLAGKNGVDTDSYDSDELWAEIIDSNLRSAYLIAGAMMSNLSQVGQANMVFTSSIAFRRGSYDSLVYSVAKAGIVGLTRSMAKRLGARGVVNAIAPGVIETRMSEEYIRSNAANLERQIPRKRVGQPSDVAKLIRFLVSEECTYVSGQTINIDGGMINS